MREYTGKIIFVGIDVRKKTYAVVCICEGDIAKRDKISANPENLVHYLKKYFPGAEINTVYEAGFCGFALHRYLEKEGIHNIVVNPSSVEVAARDRVKTDKRDAMKLAIQLSQGRLKGIHVLTEKREQQRLLTRLRDTLVQERLAFGNRIKSLLHYLGLLSCDEDRDVSQKWIAEQKTRDLPEEAQLCIQHYAECWEEINNRIKEIEKELKIQMEENKAIDLIYQSAPGIGFIHACVLATELGDMSQFKSEKALSSYTGLTPSEYSSGEQRRLGHISRQGNSRVRKVLNQAAWIAIKQDAELGEIFERIARRAGKKRAITAIARRLICRIRACFIHGTMYEYCMHSPK